MTDDNCNITPAPPRQTTAPGHFDGDGCTFPAPGHLIRATDQEG